MPEDLLQPVDAAPPATTPRPAPRPADVPEKFWDAEGGMLRIEALLKSYRELERRLSQRTAPPAADTPPEDLLRFRQAMGIPETPDGYSITSPHELCGADPDVNCRLHAAHFSNEQAQLVYDLAAQRLLPLIAEAAAEFEADRQRERLVTHFGGADRFKAMAAQLAAWGKAKLPGPVYAALASTAEGVLALERMMQTEEPGLARDAATPPQETEAELRAMMRDPRYWRTREPAFVRRVTDGFRRLVGS
ncbi:hypothetical protein QWZ14_15850 [Paeniroseomonas aquatica]|uniref:Uncharacterized protein n=2 Tax=Paeniroseomonas aquatica TaxID=373043 RepID=A0ABT8A8J2_9PROT|nr:hypothetical protein [Paeniroseomonas aquatica]MDN3565843.1 hypothetical protein [Paeniroseomonas aquatica]